jgi:C-terminal processing protease CtpA/Prc
MKGSTLMKKTLVLPLGMAGLLMGGQALAQGSGRNVTILRMAGPQLGVRLQEVDGDAMTRLKLREEKGALVTEVLRDSAAEKAGILKDDVILKFQGEAVLTAAQLTRLVREVPAGRKVDLELARNGAPVKVTATLERAEWKGDHPDIPELADLDLRLSEKLGKLGDLRFKSRGGERERSFDFKIDENGPTTFSRAGRGRLGITYTEIEGQLARYFKSPKENAILVNSVVEGSPAEKAGLKAGDLLIKLGGASIEETSDLQEAVSDLEAGKPAPLTVWRDGKNVELSVTLEAPRNTGADARRRRPVS